RTLHLHTAATELHRKQRHRKNNLSWFSQTGPNKTVSSKRTCTYLYYRSHIT
ncbi:hypothetical protein V5799_033609, partial [Amblyomma americanum]